MKKNWVNIFVLSGNSFNDILKMNHFEALLKEQDILSVIINKKDSSYGNSFGRVELHVKQEDKHIAKKIIQKNS